MGIRTYNSIEFFWEHTRKTDSCWIFTTNINALGYGGLAFRGIWIGAHVFSWKLHNPNKVIPRGWVIRHSCDNPSCVNPEHLLLGTKSDNMRDSLSRDGYVQHERISGIEHTFADKTMTREKAEAICIKNQQHNSMRSIAKEFGIGFGTVQRIIAMEHWIWKK